MDSIKGLVWYFLLTDQVTDPTEFINSSSSSTCISSACSGTCSYSIIDPVLGTGCVCTELRKNYNCAGQQCPNSNTGCSGSTSLTCSCDIKSCTLSSGTSVCDCPSGYYGITSCKVCSPECAVCSSQSTCSTCISLNASPSTTTSGCKCNLGFYNTTVLITSNACIACNDNCKICKDTKLCKTCIDSNAYALTTQGCQCKSGFYNITQLTVDGSCKSCNSDCQTCEKANICLTCKDSNSIPDTTSGCICNQGYYSTNSPSWNGACIQCPSNCITCSSSTTCTLCKDSNASPVSPGCQCNQGFYNITALNSDGTCLACKSDCITCANANSCLTCIADHAVVGSDGNCKCDTGYYGTPLLTTQGSCTLSVLTSIGLSVDDSQPSTYFEFKVTALIYHQGGGIFDLPVTATISSSSGDIYTTKSLTVTDTGTLIFWVSCKLAGENNLTVTSGSISGSITLQVQSSLLQIYSITPLVISK